MKTPYVVYNNTVFLRKIENGFELVPSYDGQIRGQLPDEKDIKRALKDQLKFKGKKTRFALIQWELPGGRFFYEALPGWGIVAGNLVTEEQDSNLSLFLSQPEIEAVIFVEDGDVEYATRAQFEERQASQVSGMQSVEGASGHIVNDLPELPSGEDHTGSEG